MRDKCCKYEKFQNQLKELEKILGWLYFRGYCGSKDRKLGERSVDLNQKLIQKHFV